MKQGLEERKALFDNTKAIISLIILALSGVAGIISMIMAFGDIFGILFGAAYCFAILFGVLVPIKQDFDNRLDDMRLAYRIGKLEMMNNSARRCNLLIKNEEQFDFIKWRNTELAKRRYYPGDFGMPKEDRIGADNV